MAGPAGWVGEGLALGEALLLVPVLAPVPVPVLAPALVPGATLASEDPALFADAFPPQALALPSTAQATRAIPMVFMIRRTYSLHSRHGIWISECKDSELYAGGCRGHVKAG
jgi:hypothetical protein